jgi:cell wall assembly regulator SMI1
MTIPHEVEQLVRKNAVRTHTPLPAGASEADINAFELRTGLSVPPEMRDWLSMFNGPFVGRAGIFGIRPTDGRLDIETELERVPQWVEKGWIPLAEDGCGDYYVLDTRSTVNGTRPVYFLDHEISRTEPDYIVASGLWPFLRFFLIDDEIDDVDEKYWPFDRERVLAEDPTLARYEGDVSFPWDEEEDQDAGFDTAWEPD